MTHAIVARQPGGPEVLDFTEIDRPVPGPGQLLVKVAATGVNFIETYQRSGTYKVAYPFTPGSEAAGVVEEVGEGVEDYTVGSRVATAEGTACYAGYIVLDAAKALPVPDAVDDQTAAALPLQGMTAHYLINSSFRVEPGHNVLVHAGAGGVGLLLIQLLKARGARVITTVSTDEKESLARGAGADEVLRYDGFAEAVRDPVPPVDPQRLNAGGSLTLTRPSLAHFLGNPQERLWRSTEIFGAAADGSLSVRIGATYPLAEARRAHEDLEGRRTTGKVLLVP
jgi:NADPH2:quinone reductase